MSKVIRGSIGIADPASYEIEVQGALDPSWADMVGSLRLEHRFSHEGVAITILTGTVPDQAALAGVLNLTYMLGMPLLSVTLLDSAGE
jgi:hypothetical protein